MIHPAKPAPTIDVPFPDELLGSRVVIQGASGAGKTYAIRRILELTHARMQHFVLDVEDELFTLRERFDYVLIGGDGADAPIGEDTAEELARALLELGVSAILQLNDLGLTGQRRVIARFLTGLMKAPRPLWHPVLVTLDEAHRYAPQNSIVASSEPIVNLATSGRKRGFGALFATQRLSQLSKDVLGQCPNRIMGRVDQSLDRRAAADTLGFAPSSPEAHRLMKLKHEFWVVGPAFAPEPRLIRFSPAVTTHLIAGHDRVPSASDPREGARPARPPHADCRGTKDGSSTERGAGMPAPSGRRRVSASGAPGLSARIQGGRSRRTRGGKSSLQRRNCAYRPGAGASSKDGTAGCSRRPRVNSALLRQGSGAQAGVHAAEKAQGRGDGATAPSGHLPAAGAMQLLATAVTHWPVRFTWGQLATLNGRKARGGHFNTSKKFLATHGLVVERDGKVEPTDAAFEKIGIPRKETPATRDSMLDMWVAALPSPAKDILQVVASHRGPIAIDDLAARLSLAPRGGHWNTGVSMLRSNDLIGTTPQGFELGQALF
jgi:hypothetical protein